MRVLRLPPTAAWLAALAFGAVALAVACEPARDAAESACGNGLDDDSDGFIDCQDFDCSGSPTCNSPGVSDAGNPGPACTRQSDCLAQGYAKDHPLRQCIGRRCVSPDAGIEVRYEIDTAAYRGLGIKFGSINTRFVLSRSIDGGAADAGAVTCGQLAALAESSRPDFLEDAGTFNLLAYDVTVPASSANPGDVITQPFLKTGTGEGFIIWTDLWAGPRDSNTGLPTGIRYGWGCFESGEPVRPLVPADHHTRVIRVKMP